MVKGTKSTIELNGQLYDARTGKIIGQAATQPATVHPVKTVDGFAKRPYHAQPIKTVPKPIEVKPAAPIKVKADVARSAPAHAAKPLEKSKTLMRPAVRKPGAVVENKAAARFKKENHERRARAAAAQQSPHVRRFHPHAHSVIKKEAVVPMATPQDSVKKQLTEQVAHLAVSTETKVKQSVDIIEESLRNASAHLETFEDKVARKSFIHRVGFKNKAANLASLSFAGLLLVGFFGYQNAPNLEVRLAAARSGVAAQMPGYSPAGFSASRGVKSEPGKVSVTFRSNTDDKSFTVSQQASNWSGDSLLNNQVASSKQPYQTYQEEGKTVYVYENGSQATWVNGGVWYKVDGNASLSSDQMLKIANSL